ncbi:MAG TPA: hypothetical protein VI756_03975, partial [Blastocatellia bacterium]
IKQAYYAKVEMLIPYKSQWECNQELHRKLDELLGKYAEAYAILGDLEKRRAYDRPNSGQRPQSEPGTTTRPYSPPSNGGNSKASPEKVKVPNRVPIHISIPGTPAWLAEQKAKAAKPNANAGSANPQVSSAPRPPRPNPRPVPPTPTYVLDLTPPKQKDRPAASDQIAAPVTPAPVVVTPQQLSPARVAAERFQQGVGLFKKKDIYSALHLLREAVRLEPGKSEYHYYLGLALSILSRARKQHTHNAGCHVTCTMDGYLSANQRVRHEAAEHLTRASELAPNNVRILADLAALYKDAGMPKKAEYYLDQAMLLDSTFRSNSMAHELMNSATEAEASHVFDAKHANER